uniref:Uncharacterized protein n=1 Tax=Anguilla anguilla TaxID=7936 RepID=A0A0E9X7F7_ANGAN
MYYATLLLKCLVKIYIYTLLHQQTLMQQHKAVDEITAISTHWASCYRSPPNVFPIRKQCLAFFSQSVRLL